MHVFLRRFAPAFLLLTALSLTGCAQTVSSAPPEQQPSPEPTTAAGDAGASPADPEQLGETVTVDWVTAPTQIGDFSLTTDELLAEYALPCGEPAQDIGQGWSRTQERDDPVLRARTLIFVSSENLAEIESCRDIWSSQSDLKGSLKVDVTQYVSEAAALSTVGGPGALETHSFDEVTCAQAANPICWQLIGDTWYRSAYLIGNGTLTDQETLAFVTGHIGRLS